MATGKVGDDLIIKSECIRIGKTIAFTECSILLESSDLLLASGSHIKAFLNEPWDQ